MFHTVLVANRGEIAVRVIRTLRALGIRSVAVYSDADAGARHVTEADIAVRVGPAPAARSYRCVPAVIGAARATGAQAIHPGYGFLSESSAFATACWQAGIVFVGPPPSAIEAMGDKIAAKVTVAQAGVAVVPGCADRGRDGARLSAAALARAVEQVGYPVLLKPSAGGGGKGMRAVPRPEDLAGAVARARREAKASFGDDTLLVERLLIPARHIEIQVLADAHGTVVHLGERECSLQRRHQKIVEEAPSALLTAAQRDRMGAAAVEAARVVGYLGAGTVEFLVGSDEPTEFYFMEMNTRLQVEHPVTELVTALDLVELQLRVAAGERLPINQDDVTLTGHAVEARIYAEDPANGFLPTDGRILALREPRGPGVRVDSGVAEGSVVGPDYDPMLSKVIAHGADRDEALRRLDAALRDTVLLGLGTNVAFLRALLADDDVRAARLDTGLVARRGVALTAADLPDDVLTAAALHALLALEPSGAVVDPFDVPGGWRVGEPAATTWRLLVAGHDPVEISVRGRAHDAEVTIGAAGPVRASAQLVDGVLAVRVGGVTRRYPCTQDGPTLWLARDGHSWAVREQTPLEAARPGEVGAGGPVRSPMPGTVTVVEVTEGQQVAAGDRLVVVEAMKMEHVLTAPVDGVVRELTARAGATVAKDAVLAVVKPQQANED